MATTVIRLVALPLIIDDPPFRAPPPDTKTFGRYCIRAVCELTDPDRHGKGVFVGRSDDLSIVNKTHEACLRNVADHKGSKRSCSEPEVTFTNWDNRCDDSVRYEVRLK